MVICLKEYFTKGLHRWSHVQGASAQSSLLAQPQLKQKRPKKSMEQEHFEPYSHSDQPK